MDRIVIVGGGLSGALVATRLLQADWPLRIMLVDPRPQTGPGLAYSTPCRGHLMNVPAGKLSLVDDDPWHFVQWLRAHDDGGASDYSFAPRCVYGRYISAVLEAASDQRCTGARCEHVRSEAIALARHGSRICIHLHEGVPIEADAVVLALGIPPSRDEALPALSKNPLRSSSCYFRSPWQPGAASDLDPEAPVLLLGSGLTAVDAVIGLHEQGHRGIIHMVSRRGLLPRRHAPHLLPPCAAWKPNSHSVRELCAQVRERISRAETRGEDWRTVIDGLRAHTPRLWQGLPPAERRRFLRHLRPYWEVHRHRMAPEVAAFIHGRLQEEGLKVHAGHIRSIQPTPQGARAEISVRGSAGDLVLDVRRVINCIGPEYDLRKSPHPFCKSLFDQGLAQAGPLGLGILTTAEGEVIDARGQVTPNLLTLGPARIGRDWETTAAAEIRAQSAALVARLLGAARRAREGAGVTAPRGEAPVVLAR